MRFNFEMNYGKIEFIGHHRVFKIHHKKIVGYEDIIEDTRRDVSLKYSNLNSNIMKIEENIKEENYYEK